MVHSQSQWYPPIEVTDFPFLAETCKDIMQDYELPGISDARDQNLNRFMQFCGVTYRLVGEISF